MTLAGAKLLPEDRFAIGDALLIEAISRVHARCGRTVVVGLSGSQGSGKSTTAARIALSLTHRDLRTAVLSIDDFYLTKREREKLASSIHPLLATRGAPGTHDLDMLRATINALLAAPPNGVTPLPSFDKLADDRLCSDRWRQHQGRPDVILLEGWCVGARPQPESALAEPINTLEREADQSGRWRGWVNRQLAYGYAKIFADLNLILMLRAPSFDCVYEWRAEQEAHMARSSPTNVKAMTNSALKCFIEHYERITRWMIEDEPADLIINLDRGRAPTSCRIRTSCQQLPAE